MALLPRRHSEPPFAVTGDLRKVYDSISFRSAFAALNGAIGSRQRLIVLTGEPGSGKTMLLRAAHKAHARNRHAAFMRRGDAADDMLVSVLVELQAARIPAEREARMRELALRLAQRPSPAVLFVDDAHLLSDQNLGEVAAFASWRDGDTDILQIVLAGPPTLKEQLGRRGFVEIERPATSVVRLGPLLRAELAHYVAHHLALARHRRVFFSAGALDRLLFHSHGIPLHVNLLCASVLTSRKTHVDAADIDAAAFINRMGAAAHQDSRQPPPKASAIAHKPGPGFLHPGSKRMSALRRGAAAMVGFAGISVGAAYLRTYEPLIRLDQIDVSQVRSIGGTLAQSWPAELGRPRVMTAQLIPAVTAGESEPAAIGSSDPPPSNQAEETGQAEEVEQPASRSVAAR